MASFSVKSFERKLKEMSSRQDSVQTVSLWLIHHRAHSKTVVNVWQDRIKKAKHDRRLVLFYLANDVIQNSRKKGKEFSSSFGKVLLDTMPYLRDSKIRPSVERVLKIWQERRVFDKEVVQKLIAQLYRASKSELKAEIKLEEKENKSAKPEKKEPILKPKRPVPTDFKVNKVVGALVTMQELEAETQRRETLVSQTRLDASSSDGIKQLKDRAGGNRFSMDFEESSSKIEELVLSLESENQHRHTLINSLEDSDAYYDAALNEATIIANAYRSFGNRLHAMKKKLDNKIRKFATAEKDAPVSAPKASFLSSGLSGILEEMNKSPVASPVQSNEVEKEEEKDKEEAEEVKEEVEEEMKKEKVVDPTIDHVGVADMDIESNSENEDETLESVAKPQQSDAKTQQSDTTSVENGSAVSTPTAVTKIPTLADDAPKSADAAPVVDKLPSTTSSTQQFGYTMTVNSTEESGADSPASHDSAPSPEGSPELNLEQYDEPTTNMMTSEDINATTDENLVARPQSTVNASPETVETAPQVDSEVVADKKDKKGSNVKPPSTMHLIAQLISKTRRQHDDLSVENEKEMASENASPVRAENNTGDKPLFTLIDSLFPVLSTSLRTIHGTTGDKQGQQRTTPDEEKDKREQPMDKNVKQITSGQSLTTDTQKTSKESTGPGKFDGVVPNVPFSPGGPRPPDVTKSDLPRSPISLHIPHQDGPNGTEPLEGDNTPEHGSEIPDVGEAGPIIIRAGTSYPDHPEFRRHPVMTSPRPRVFDRHPTIDGRQFGPRHERLCSPPRDLRAEVRRNSTDEALLDERYVRNMRSPGIRPPHTMPPPMDRERWHPPDRFILQGRNDVMHENELQERRDAFPERPNEFHVRERREMFQREEFHPLGRRDEFPRMERPSNIRPMDQRNELASVERGEHRVMEEFPPEVREVELRDGQKEFPAKDRTGPTGEFTIRERPGMFRPTEDQFPGTVETPNEAHSFDNRLSESRPNEGRVEVPPLDGADNVRSIEGRIEVPPMDRPGDISPRGTRGMFHAMGEHEQFPPIQRPGEQRPPMDVRNAEFHPAEREEGHFPRDGFRNIPHPVGRAARIHLRPQRGLHRPELYHGPPTRAPYRGERIIQGFHPRFSRAPAYRIMGAPMRLKRPGPPFHPDAPKRPHF